MTSTNFLLVSAAVLALAACSEEPGSPVKKQPNYDVPGAPPGGAADAAAKHAPASEVKETTDLIEFAYAYPLEAARIPEVAAWLDKDRQVKRDALLIDARRDKAAADREKFPYHAHSHLQKWQRVTDTPRFLSLSSEIGTYTGGAHGMTSFDTLMWDRTRRRIMKPLDLFVSGEAFDAAIGDAFCARIKHAKAAKGIQTPDEPDSPWGKCPPASAQTVWIGSSDGRHLDRLTIAIAPYEIGPFAEGSYKINVPVTEALARAVKPEFAREFLPIN